MKEKPICSLLNATAMLVALTIFFVLVSCTEKPTVAISDPTAGELRELEGKLPSQSHTMMDVAYHFGNLWFAGRAGNWPRARFYADETHSRLRWAVRVKPVRPLTGGGELHLEDLLGAIENSTLKELQDSVKGGEKPRFEKAYTAMMESCYACHVAAEKPYLRLHLPQRPPEAMIDFAPAPAPSPEN